MRCHQTFSDCVSVLASVTNDVVVRVLYLIVYYFVIDMDMHVSITISQTVLLVIVSYAMINVIILGYECSQ